MRKGTYQAVEAVEAPDAAHGRFRLKWPEASFLVNLASPYNWIYKADILAKDMRWYETNVMGTGPFKFVEHVKGSHWVGKKNPDYWDKGKPYLDGYRALFITASSAQVAAIRGERAHVQFRGFSPAERDALVAGARAEDHRAGERVGLRRARRDEPRAEALRRQARAPRADAGPRPLRGLEEPVADRHREGGGRDPGAGHAVGHAAGRAREAGRLRARHRRQPGRGAAAAARGRRARRLRVHVQEPRDPAAVRADRASGSSTSGGRSGST